MVIVPIRWLLDNGYWTSHDIPRWLDHDLTDTIYSFIGGSCGRRRHVFVPIGNLLTCRWWARVEKWWVNECEMDVGWAGRDHFFENGCGDGSKTAREWDAILQKSRWIQGGCWGNMVNTGMGWGDGSKSDNPLPENWDAAGQVFEGWSRLENMMCGLHHFPSKSC